MSDCKKCGNPYDHYRFPQKLEYTLLAGPEYLLITCGRCGYSWEEPTKDQRCT